MYKCTLVSSQLEDNRLKRLKLDCDKKVLCGLSKKILINMNAVAYPTLLVNYIINRTAALSNCVIFEGLRVVYCDKYSMLAYNMLVDLLCNVYID